MAGYTRQSVADIIANAVIKAAPVNAEYNAIRDAFAFSGGHKHDGSSTEGAYVPLIADVDALNKVVVDTANNRISFYSEVSGAAVEQVRIQDGAIVPVTDDDVDLGAAGAEFKDLYIDGVGYIDTLTVHENATIAGTLGVTGVITATGGVVGDVTGDLTGNVTGDLTGDVTSSGTSTFATVDTTGNTSIGGTFAVTGTSTFTGAISAGSLTTTGNSTHATVDINGGAIDGTVIGASTAAAGTFTTVTTTGQATLASADINGGTIDGSVIGGTTAQAITGTTITANTGFTGALTGNVTGNVTGNLTGDVTGDVTGDLTGNVTASTGTTTLNDLVVNGTVDFTSTALLNVSDPTAPQHAATKSYVDTEVANLVDSAPAALDTLNELAAALGDDADFSNTVTTSIAAKLPLAGGTMTGAIAMGTSKITGLGDPTAAQDAATKAYVDTADATKLNLSGGTMTGAIDMGANKVTTTYTPTDNADLTTKTYVDGILGSATAAADSAAAAATSETNAATSETNAANSASAAAASYDDFDDRWLGAKASAPTVDNDGDALVTGAVYFNTTNDSLYIWTGSAWSAAVFDTNDALFGANNLSDVASAATSRTNLGLGTAATTASTDYATAAQGTTADAALPKSGGTMTGNLAIASASGFTNIEIGGPSGAYIDLKSPFSDDYDARIITTGSGLQITTSGDNAVDIQHNGSTKIATRATGIDVTGNATFGDNDKAIFGAGSDLQIYHDGSNSVIADTGTGALITYASDFIIQQNGSNERMADFAQNGAVRLYHDGAVKTTTTATGVSVTGDIAVTGTVDGRDIATNIPASLGTAGQVLTVNAGATAGEWADAGGGGGLEYLTGSTTLVAGGQYLVSISAATTLTLPASPSAGDTVRIVAAEGNDSNILTVARNGSTIQSLSEDMAVDILGIDFILWYNGTTWSLI
jgi:hypothetical protein